MRAATSLPSTFTRRRPRLQKCEGERVKGIEPSCAAWEAAILPLNYTRGGIADCRFQIFDCNRNQLTATRSRRRSWCTSCPLCCRVACLCQGTTQSLLAESYQDRHLYL